MGNYRLEITLLSDLCVADGSSYASMLDTDICYDSYGFPYIPARRIKGCLRECALELKEWGKDIAIKALFGEEGYKGAKVRIGNAYIRNYASMKAEVEKNKEHIVFHPQNVLNQFSYIRTQTSLDYETGVAEEGSLRTMRVANKGLVFEAEITIEEAYKEEFVACCHVLTEMGLARTRGLGDVSVRLIEAIAKEPIGHAWLVEDANYLEYVLRVEEPIIVNTADYIEGSKMLGILISGMKTNDIGDLVCSNAYIGKSEVRYTEVPACYYAIKNNKQTFVNQIIDSEHVDTGIQLNRMKHAYVTKIDGKLERAAVEVEERYHHRRPEDKSIGRARESAEKDSVFYKMSSISSGQEFYGYIKGSAEQIKEIYAYITQKNEFYIGKSKNSEYGKSSITILNTQSQKEHQVSCSEFIVKLEAPAIVYSDKAFYSVQVDDLVKEVNATLGLHTEVKPYRTYLNYVTLGGYNVTWRARKPMIEAFDKGSVLHYKFDTPVTLTTNNGCHIGERFHEGYGEISLSTVDRASERRYLEYADTKQNLKDYEAYVVEKDSLAEDICKKLFLSYLELNAIESVENFAKGKRLSSYRSTVSNMLLMTKEQNTMKAIRYAVEERYKGMTEKKVEKRRYAEDILNYIAENMKDVMEKFNKNYQLIWTVNKEDDTVYMAYLSAFLKALKYEIRQLEIKMEKGEQQSES